MSRRSALLLAITAVSAITIAVACANPDFIIPAPETKTNAIEFTIVPNDLMGFAIGDTGVTGVQVTTTNGFAPAQRITIHVADSSIASIVAWQPTCSFSSLACEEHLVLRGMKFGSTTVTAESGGESASIGVFVWGPRSDYETIDLGTLGGAMAYPTALNDSGQVVGYSTTASGQQHAFLWSNGVMRDIGTSFAGASAAQTITNSGLVGMTSDYSGDSHVYVWRNGTLTEFGRVIPGTSETKIIGMSNTDVVAWTAGQEHYFSARWHNGVWANLGGLYAPLGSSQAHAMNERGQVVGGSVVSGYVGSDIDHPFVWQNGVMRELALLGPNPCPAEPQRDCSAGEAVDINDAGTIVGWSGGVEQTPQAVLWRDGDPPLALGFRHAVAVNGSDDVVGNETLAGSYWQEAGRGDAYFWHQGTLTNLGSLGRGETSVADLNDQSVVIGRSRAVDKRLHAFAWKQGQAGLIDLGSNGEVSGAISLNARGDIIGWTAACLSTDTNGVCNEWSANTRAVLWRARAAN